MRCWTGNLTTVASSVERVLSHDGGFICGKSSLSRRTGSLAQPYVQDIKRRGTIHYGLVMSDSDGRLQARRRSLQTDTSSY